MLVSVAVIITCGRFYLRWRYSHELRWDDFFNGLALVCLVAYSAVSQAQLSNVDLSFGLRLSVAASMLLWTTLYSVKAAFLALCWFIFHISARFRLFWWFVTAYIFLSFWPLFLISLWQCGEPLHYTDIQACEQLGAEQYTVNMAAINLALHVSSDCLMIALPAMFIRDLHLSTASKISVAGVFAIAIVDTILGTIRLAAFLYNALRIKDVDLTVRGGYVTLGILEPGLAVIVCALSVYKLLLPPFRRRRRRDKPVVLQYKASKMSNAVFFAQVGNLKADHLSPLKDETANKVQT